MDQKAKARGPRAMDATQPRLARGGTGPGALPISIDDGMSAWGFRRFYVASWASNCCRLGLRFLLGGQAGID